MQVTLRDAIGPRQAAQLKAKPPRVPRTAHRRLPPALGTNPDGNRRGHTDRATARALRSADGVRFAQAFAMGASGGGSVDFAIVLDVFEVGLTWPWRTAAHEAPEWVL